MKGEFPLRVLVVAAHPDDEVFGCGGTIIKHIQKGNNVNIITLTDGITARRYNPGIKRFHELKKYKSEILMRRNEFFKATNIMGIKKERCFNLNFPDQRLDLIPILQIIKSIENYSQKILPDIVYTHHWGDLNKDHRICCEAVFTAFRPSQQLRRKTDIFCYEIPGNMNFLPPRINNNFRPNYFINISPFIYKKIDAINAYKSERKVFPNPLSIDKILFLAKKRAKKIKCKFAEAFVKIKD